MSKKITDMLDQIEEVLLEEIAPIDIDEVRMKCIEDNIFRRIEAIASNENQTPKVSIKYGKRRMKQHLLIASIIFVLMITAIGAISMSDTLKEFFGEHIGILMPNTTEVAKSVSQNGITMTVDTAIVGNNGSIIIVRFTKNDKTSFIEGSEIKDFNVTMDKGGSNATTTWWELSQDQKVLTYIVENKASSEAIDSQVTIRAEDIVIMTHQEEEVPIELDKLEGKDLMGEAKDMWMKDRKEPVGVPIQHPYTTIALSNVQYKEEMLRLTIEYSTQTHNSLWQMLELRDLRTEKSLDTEKSGESHSTNTPVKEATWEYKVMGEEDLQYLKFYILYYLFDTQVDGVWETTFTLEKNENTKSSKKKHEISVGEDLFIVEEIEASALGVRIEGDLCYKDKDNPKYYQKDIIPTMYLIMKDGSKQELYQGVCSTTPIEAGKESFSMYAEFAREDDWATLSEEEKDKRREENIKIVRERKIGLQGLTDRHFIPIDEVVAIQIEDVKIKLR